MFLDYLKFQLSSVNLLSPAICHAAAVAIGNNRGT